MARYVKMGRGTVLYILYEKIEKKNEFYNKKYNHNTPLFERVN